jgi:hypothetical protein
MMLADEHSFAMTVPESESLRGSEFPGGSKIRFLL